MKPPSLPQLQKLIVTMQQNPVGAAMCIALASLASTALAVVYAILQGR